MKSWCWFVFLPILSIFSVSSLASEEVEIRVARVSLLEGTAKIQREEVWEEVALNLPVVQGDIIATDPDSRLEIQFSRYAFLRVGSDSYLKIVTLQDDGVVVSVSQGDLSLSLFQFDKEKEFFEIDAPGVTIAVKSNGTYRVDAGNKISESVVIKVFDEGEARIYSTDSGFTIRNGRFAKLWLKGDMAGEWDFGSALTDEIDKWVEKRNAYLSERIRQAGYGKFYDDSFFGAEDLEKHGQWLYTEEYGWGWKPYDSAISSYRNWVPYRYGHWRWIPPIGWVWINDEPWGWVTYHYGRWVRTEVGWIWVPYDYYKSRRWRPALVTITYIGDYVCWYPLPYYHPYYNYTVIYNVRVRNYRIINQQAPQLAPQPTPAPSPVPNRGDVQRKPPIRLDFPPDAVTAMKKDEFGLRRMPLIPGEDISAKALRNEPSMLNQIPIDIQRRRLSDFSVREPQHKIPVDRSTGVINRTPGIAIDEEIRKSKVFDGRATIVTVPSDQKADQKNDLQEVRKNPGVIRRLPSHQIFKSEDSDEKRQSPMIEPTLKTSSENRQMSRPLIKVDKEETSKRREEHRIVNVQPIYPPVEKQIPYRPTLPSKTDGPSSTKSDRQNNRSVETPPMYIPMEKREPYRQVPPFSPSKQSYPVQKKELQRPVLQQEPTKSQEPPSRKEETSKEMKDS